MATLTVWKYDDADTAAKVRDRLAGLEKQELIQVVDAVVVTWPEDKDKPKTDQSFHPAGAGAVGGAFWGLLFGLIFFVPFFGMAVGALSGAAAGALSDFGIDDDFIDSVKSKVTRGTSALFVMSAGEVPDRIHQETADFPGELIATNLSVADEEALRAIFAA